MFKTAINKDNASAMNLKFDKVNFIFHFDLRQSN